MTAEGARGRANVLTRERLQQLLAKERTHDDYYFAMVGMRERTDRVHEMAAAGTNGFGRPVLDRRYDEEAADPQSPILIRAAAWGYRKALSDLSLTIVNAGRQGTSSQGSNQPR